jgi:FkbM family methyltransferase
MYHKYLVHTHRKEHNDTTFISDVNQRYDEQTTAVMKRVLSHDSNCIDVGCHQGSILREMLRFAPDGQHFAFEPIPELSDELRQMFPKVNVYQLALSDKAGTSKFQHVLSNPGYSGLRRRHYDRPDEVVEETKVKTDLLDNIVPTVVPIHFIKIDVEGGEFQVLRGGKETIRRNRPVIVFEHGLGAADCYKTQPQDVYDLLYSSGLTISTMERWLGNQMSFSRDEFVAQFYKQLNFYFIAYP